MRWIALIPAVLLLAGCAQKPTVWHDPLGSPPRDFSVELTVLTGPQAPASDEAHLRQSRYVLFADGSLCQGDDLDHSKSPDWLPPLTRVVSRRQMSEMWSLVQQLGFYAGPSKVNEAVNFKLATPPSDGLIYLAGFSAYGERWTFERPCAATLPDPAMVQLTRELARLAWASDQSPASATILPRRYDFGPDPYERYRIPGAWPPPAESNSSRKKTELQP